MSNTAAMAGSAVGSSAEHLTLMLLYQLVVILAFSRLVSWISTRFLGQTAVAGEILAGLLLGPSLIGALFPDLSHALFVPETRPIFVGLAQLGLILLMFQIGMEFQMTPGRGRDGRAVALISLTGIIIPFALGYATAPFFWRELGMDPDQGLLAFRLFFAIAMSITAIPILGRIFMELGLSHTRTASLVIGSAAIDDICGWMLLGLVAAIVAANFDMVMFLARIAGVALFVAVMLALVRPFLSRWVAGRMAKEGGTLDTTTIAGLLLVLLGAAIITSNLGIFAIIGGFIVGHCLQNDRAFVAQWKMRVGGLVQVLLLPLFFAYTGLRTDVGSLSASGWGLCALVCLVAFAGKFGGAYLACRALGESHRQAATIGVAMNTRALMELIVLNIGYDMGVLPKPMFSMLVVMAIVSTFMATPLIRWLMASERVSPELTRARLAGLSAE
ncbi:cation:proton antiporter [Niveispirillum sp. BGYR6]|uniref:cation:proton antiporter n=1 Tax=Niveispirillum sp. BGYR6 TaxID=2971249 RepID=UPI0022B9837B|nr:cation:proton antiporter [Niveispirillum sp. BGYR6]MDG5494757.1 cation:proton antiporter [Niveispirillum sp. BGYR6]